MHSSTKQRVIVSSVFSSAITKREFWKVPIGRPNALRSLM